MDLIRREVWECLPEALGQVGQERADGMRRIRTTDVAGHVDVVKRAQGGALGQTARQHHLPQCEIRMLINICLQLLAKPPRLRAIFLRLVLREVHSLFGKAHNIAMPNMVSAHRIVSGSPASLTRAVRCATRFADPLETIWVS